MNSQAVEVMHKRMAGVWTNLGKKLLNVGVDRIVDLGFCVNLNELYHLYILNQSGYEEGLGGSNTAIWWDCFSLLRECNRNGHVTLCSPFTIFVLTKEQGTYLGFLFRNNNIDKTKLPSSYNPRLCLTKMLKYLTRMIVGLPHLEGKSQHFNHFLTFQDYFCRNCSGLHETS